MKLGTTRNPKFKRLMKLTGMDVRSTTGTLELLWLFTMDQAPAGDIGRWRDSEIEAAVEWDGEDGFLVAALVEARWLDRCSKHRLVVHDWRDHIPRFIKQRVDRGLVIAEPHPPGEDSPSARKEPGEDSPSARKEPGEDSPSARRVVGEAKNAPTALREGKPSEATRSQDTGNPNSKELDSIGYPGKRGPGGRDPRSADQNSDKAFEGGDRREAETQPDFELEDKKLLARATTRLNARRSALR